jgi:formylglycine-generating enzyme required for sulfatase activity
MFTSAVLAVVVAVVATVVAVAVWGSSIGRGSGATAITHPSTTAPSVPQNFTNTLGMEFTRIGPGRFLMGSPPTEKGRSPNERQHEVALTKPFWLGVTLVTRGQFAKFVEDFRYKTDAERDGRSRAYDPVTNTFIDNVDGASWKAPGFAQADDHPAVQISRNDADAFCKWLSATEGVSYRLPTEAEFEFACRAGTQTAYFWGDDPDGGSGYANCADLAFKDNSAWSGFNWRDGFIFTSPVRSFMPNPWGLYDMIGNASEWCADTYGDCPDIPATDPLRDVPVHNPGVWHVYRGGSWAADPKMSRSATRGGVPANYRFSTTGFRVVVEPRSP